MLYKCITANTSAIWQQAAHTTDQLSSPSYSTRAIQKSLTPTKNIWEFSGTQSGEWQDRKSKRTRQEEKKEKKQTREEIGKGNQMTALRFQTGGGYQTLIYGLLSGDGGGCSRPSSLKKPASGASLDALIIKLFLWTSSYKLHTFISAIWYWWSLLYIAILRSRADSLRSHVVLREWLAFYSVFLNIHRSGVLTALAWLVPHETAAVSAQLLCTPYSHAPCHFMQSHVRKVYASLAWILFE